MRRQLGTWWVYGPTALASTALFAVACIDFGVDVSTIPLIEDSAVDDTGDLPGHAVLIQPIWDRECTNVACHAPGVEPPPDLSIDGYPDLIGVASTQLPSMPYIDPGDPTNSYLMHKLNATQMTVGGQGTQMPRLLTPLPPEDLLVIEQWIQDGALP